MSMNHKLLAAAVLLALGTTAQANPVAEQAKALIRANPGALRAATGDEFVLTQAGVDVTATEGEQA